ncbi:hypothetical protein D4764_0109220 [Takifugu flavidus]|uniref:Uncharacterized protein n=1 Tax=Takifugu flavidus TaxID=433684 RepID=A0A5C6MF69_9TELE|nr:hypothetical protein D4764_0109220 [Takifugu flavidus]
MSFLRRVAGLSLRDRVRSSAIREELGVESLLEREMGTIKTEPSNVRLSEHCDSHGLSTLPGTHGSSTLPFTRSFRTCEADKETVEGIRGATIIPNNSTSTTRAFLNRSLTGWRRIQAATFIPNTPKTRMRGQEKGGQRADHHPIFLLSKGEEG